MPWVKLDDQFFTKAKARRAGKDGRALYLAGLCFCAANLTDGVITDDDLGFVAASADVKVGAADRLLLVGLWERLSDGYQVHDYLEYNPPAEQVKEERRRDAERKRQERRKGGKHKPSDKTSGKSPPESPNGRPPGHPEGVREESDRNPDVPSRPVPSIGTRSSSTHVGGADRNPDDDDDQRSDRTARAVAGAVEGGDAGTAAGDPAGGAMNGRRSPPENNPSDPPVPDVLGEVWALIAEAELAARVAEKGPVGLPEEWRARARYWAENRHAETAAQLVVAHPDWPASRVAAELEPDRFADDTEAVGQRRRDAARAWGARMAGVLTEDELVDDAARHFAADPEAQAEALDAWRAATENHVSQGAR